MYVITLKVKMHCKKLRAILRGDLLGWLPDVKYDGAGLITC